MRTHSWSIMLAALMLAPAAGAQNEIVWQRQQIVDRPDARDDVYYLRQERAVDNERDRVEFWERGATAETPQSGPMPPVVDDPQVEYHTGNDPSQLWRMDRFDPEYDYEQWVVHRTEKNRQLGGQVVLGDAYGPGQYGVGADFGFGSGYGRDYIGGDGLGVQAGVGAGFPGIGTHAGLGMGQYELGGNAGIGPGYSERPLGVGAQVGLGRNYTDVGAEEATGLGTGVWAGAGPGGLGAGGEVDVGQQGFGAQAGLGPDYGPHGLSVGGGAGFGTGFAEDRIGGEGFGVHAGAGLGLGGIGTRAGLGVGEEDYGVQLGLGPSYGQPGALGVELSLGRIEWPGERQDDDTQLAARESVWNDWMR